MGLLHILTVRHNPIIRNMYRAESAGIQRESPVIDANEVRVENPAEETFHHRAIKLYSFAPRVATENILPA